MWKCLRLMMTLLSMKSPHDHITLGTILLKPVISLSLTPIFLGVLGAPLPVIKLHAPAVMLNVLGQHVEAAEQYVTENSSAHLHMYGKIEAKHNRKMGHVTLFSDVPDSVEELGEGIDF